MARNLTDQVRSISEVTKAVANGNLEKFVNVDVQGEMLELKSTVNSMVVQLRVLANEVTRVSLEVGTEGRLGGQAVVPGVQGTWKELANNVNLMAENLTNQVRSIATVTKAVANGDLTKRIEVDVKGEMLDLKNTVNGMTESLSTFADEVTRVAREVGTEGRLGGQANVSDVHGTWKVNPFSSFLGWFAWAERYEITGFDRQCQPDGTERTSLAFSDLLRGTSH